MKYSLKEALQDLRNPKKTLKEDINTDLKAKLDAIKDPIQLVQVYENSADDTLKLTYGREAALEDYINEYFEDGYESMRINLGSSGLAPFNDDDIEGDYEFDTPEEVLEVVHKYPDYYWFLDGDPELELATKEQVIEQILEFGDPQEVEKAINTYVVDDANESLNEDVNTEKDNFEAAVEFYQTNPNNLNSRQLANNIGKHSKFNLPDHLVSAILNGVTDYAEATEFDGNDAIAELRDNIESLNGKSLVEVLSFFDDIEFAENWNTFNIVDSNNNVIFDDSADLGENDWYASIADLCYDGPLTKYSNDTVKDIIIDSKHSDNMDARKVTIVMQNNLNEAKQGKVVTAATILKKSQNEIFAESTEEGMRKKVLSILEKNKDKMSPENYNTVVKTMTKCPKSAVPSTVWTMLNPNQKVGR